MHAVPMQRPGGAWHLVALQEVHVALQDMHVAAPARYWSFGAVLHADIVGQRCRYCH